MAYSVVAPTYQLPEWGKEKIVELRVLKAL